MKNYKAPKNLLENKNIIVTGAANGIGKAVATSYAKYGATVILIDKDEKNLEITFDEITEKKYPEPVLVPVDFLKTNPQQYNEIATSIENELGHLDGIVHCAGWLGTLTPLESFDDEVWSKVLTINLQSPYWLTRACLKLLQASGSASVIFTTADVGRNPCAYWGAYSIAAAGIDNLAKVWSEELEDQGSVRINTIDPGAVRTKMRANSHPGEDPGNLPRPEDVTATYLYLMGKESGTINGQLLTISE